MSEYPASKNEIPKGSGNYYAYRKRDGDTEYLGRWNDYVKEVEFEKWMMSIFEKEQVPIVNEALVTDATVRRFKSDGLSDGQIASGLDDSTHLSSKVILGSYPDMIREFKDIYISDGQVNFRNPPGVSESQTELGTLLKYDGDGQEAPLLNLDFPERATINLATARSVPSEDIENVMTKYGAEGRALKDSIRTEATIYHFLVRCDRPVLIDHSGDVQIVVEDEHEALVVENEMAERGVNLKSNTHNTSIRPRTLNVLVDPVIMRGGSSNVETTR